MTEQALRPGRAAGRPPLGVVTPRGPLDAKAAAAVERTLAASGFLAVVVNLQHVRYVNSAGMAYLVGLADRLEAAGGGLHLANPQPKVRVVLDLMGLSGFLRLHATVEAAVRAARPRGPGRPLRRGSPA